jgi:hypothetical protein
MQTGGHNRVSGDIWWRNMPSSRVLVDVWLHPEIPQGQRAASHHRAHHISAETIGSYQCDKCTVILISHGHAISSSLLRTVLETREGGSGKLDKTTTS